MIKINKFHNLTCNVNVVNNYLIDVFTTSTCNSSKWLPNYNELLSENQFFFFKKKKKLTTNTATLT